MVQPTIVTGSRVQVFKDEDKVFKVLITISKAIAIENSIINLKVIIIFKAEAILKATVSSAEVDIQSEDTIIIHCNLISGSKFAEKLKLSL